MPILLEKSQAYGWLMLAGIFVSLLMWARLAKRDDRLVVIYVAGLLGAFAGAKLVYFLAEGWLHWNDPDRWMVLATGKSVTGALLGGYPAVEIAKKMCGYNRATGDWFAVVVPVGILFGRVGCLLQGCCLGKVCAPAWYTLRDAEGAERWPAVPLEMAFNILALVVAVILGRMHKLPGQHFHLYLMGYGVFRFFHEFMRNTPGVAGWLSGYQIAALAIFMLGLWGFILRRAKSTALTELPAPAHQTQ
jgi:phosphatidylglycerol:prolipoprotein diacylglycerol transferase